MNGSGSSETTESAIGLRTKALLVDRSHNPWREADRRAAYGKSVCAVRGGGGWRRAHPGTAPVLDPTNSACWPASPPTVTDRLGRRVSAGGTPVAAPPGRDPMTP